MPEGTLRIAKGVSSLSQRSVKSRYGSTKIEDLSGNAHSLFYFNDTWFAGYSTGLYRLPGKTGAGAPLSGSGTSATLSGDRLIFTKMPPTAGIKDYLFVSGGGELLKVDDESTSVVDTDLWKWTASGHGTNEYYLEDAGGGSVSLTQPSFVVGDGELFNTAAIGALTTESWAWDDNDALGFDTLYVRLADGADPDSKATDFIMVGYVSPWGIPPPDTTPTLADGGASGNLEDGGTYKYRFTHYNAKTGTRSNPNTADTDISLLLHMDGADEGTTFTDSSDNSHSFTAVGNANTEQGTKKFGTASYEGDGTTDCIYCADHISLNMQSEEFTIDWWARFPDVSTAKEQSMFSKYQDSSNYIWLCIYTGATDAVEIYYRSGGAWEFAYYISGITLAVDTFYHFALIRGWSGDPNKFAITQDGTLLASWTYNGNIQNSGSFVIGAQTTAAALSANGFIDEFRIVKGRALWTDEFAVPTVATGSYTITLTAGQTKTAISNIPTYGNNPSIDTTEIWRTIDGGSTYFRCSTISSGDTTYTDNVADADLESTELLLDNIKPYAWFDDCWYHNASAFWISRSQEGQKGRVYYSPIGRCEAVQGFINVTSDDDPLQRVVGYAGQLFVISESGVFQIIGTNPYTPRPVPGIPGTIKPFTVAITHLGPMWEVEDGVVLFRGGSSAQYLALDAMRDLFRGVTTGGISGFSGVVATYGRGEYYIADGTVTLALDLDKQRWRELSCDTDALHYAKDADELGVSFSSDMLIFEEEGTTADNSSTYTFTVETPQQRAESDSDIIVQHVTIDCDTTNETLAATLVYDDAQTLSLGNVQENGRGLAELPVGRACRNFGLKLSGSIDAAVEVFNIDFDIHVPRTEGK